VQQAADVLLRQVEALLDVAVAQLLHLVKQQQRGRLGRKKGKGGGCGWVSG
jgi:hypothetical protein